MEGVTEKCLVCKDYSKQWIEHYYWNHLDLKRMSFIKFMKGNFSQHLRIPKKFMENFRGDLATTVDLRDPSGRVWHVELRKDKNHSLLQSGWTEFAKDHELEKHDLLIFRYDRNSCFNVVMYDETGCEKASSYFVGNHDPRNQERRADSVISVDSSSDDEESEKRFSSSSRDLQPLRTSSNSNNISSGSSSDSEYCGKRKGIGSLKASKIHFKQGFENTQWEKLDDCVSYMKLRNRKGIGSSKASKVHFKQGSENTQREKLDNCISTMKLSDGEKKKAMELTRGAQSGNPFFVLVMRATYVKAYVNVPHDFARDYLPSSKTIVLQIDGSKRKWPVNYIVQNKDSKFIGKWMTFVRDNNLKEGDICLFELVKGVKNNVIKVHISPKEPKPLQGK